jgi:hypothetical protein
MKYWGNNWKQYINIRLSDVVELAMKKLIYACCLLFHNATSCWSDADVARCQTPWKSPISTYQLVPSYLVILQTKANGPDQIPTRILKEACNEIAPFLTIILRQSLITGEVPRIGDRTPWKSPISTYQLVPSYLVILQLSRLVGFHRNGVF